MKVVTVTSLNHPAIAQDPNSPKPETIKTVDGAVLANVSVTGGSPSEAIMGIVSAIAHALPGDKTLYLGPVEILSTMDGSKITAVIGLSGEPALAEKLQLNTNLLETKKETA